VCQLNFDKERAEFWDKIAQAKQEVAREIFEGSEPYSKGRYLFEATCKSLSHYLGNKGGGE